MPTRRRLPHEPPRWIDPSREIWFITVCCETRGVNQLARDEIGAALIETIQHRNQSGVWWTWLVTVMPDHVHLLTSFPSTGDGMVRVMTEWKRWTARTLKIRWQQNFFDHRLRRDESYYAKADYILHNPVRAGLVADQEQWPYHWWPEETGFTGLAR